MKILLWEKKYTQKIEIIVSKTEKFLSISKTYPDCVHDFKVWFPTVHDLENFRPFGEHFVF